MNRERPDIFWKDRSFFSFLHDSNVTSALEMDDYEGSGPRNRKDNVLC